MADVGKWIQDNQILSGIAGVVLTALFGGVAYFYQKRRKDSPSPTIQQAGHVGTGNVVNVSGSGNTLAVGATAPSSSAEQVRVDVKEALPQRRVSYGTAGGFDVDSGREFRNEAWGTAPAQLKIVCHNLTEKPVVIDEILLLNADSNQALGRFDNNPTRIEGLDFKEIEMNWRLNMPLPLRCQINITTVRGGAFNSKPFEWGKA